MRIDNKLYTRCPRKNAIILCFAGMCEWCVIYLFNDISFKQLLYLVLTTKKAWFVNVFLHLKFIPSEVFVCHFVKHMIVRSEKRSELDAHLLPYLWMLSTFARRHTHLSVVVGSFITIEPFIFVILKHIRWEPGLQPQVFFYSFQLLKWVLYKHVSIHNVYLLRRKPLEPSHQMLRV